jgi:hypothetical protein
MRSLLNNEDYLSLIDSDYKINMHCIRKVRTQTR